MPVLTGLYRGLLGVLCCTVRVRPLEGSAVLHMDLGLLTVILWELLRIKPFNLALSYHQCHSNDTVLCKTLIFDIGWLIID